MTPKERVEETEDIRRKARRQFKESRHKRGERLPGEVEFRQDIAVILKIAGYSHTQIASSIGETRGTVKKWFEDKDVKKKFTALSETLSDAAKSLLHTYTIEAIQTLVEIMRNSQDEDQRRKAAVEILDRGGVPKVSRSEQKNEAPTAPEISKDEESRFRNLTPEEQSELADRLASITEFAVEKEKDEA